MLVLHHHQRPGQEIAAPFGGRRRANDPGALCPGHPALLHHRRQPRPQQGLGGDLRPDHRVARTREHEYSADGQVDTLCHKIPNFIEKAARAGNNRVLVGLESVNAANLLAAKKRQNKITEYRAMLLAWKNAGAITTAGYILGFPFDTPESIREDIAIIQKELPLDILEFFCLTPLPGSEDHKVLWQK